MADRAVYFMISTMFFIPTVFSLRIASKVEWSFDSWPAFVAPWTLVILFGFTSLLMFAGIFFPVKVAKIIEKLL